VSAAVNPRRRTYNSAGRLARAAANRTRVLDVAQRAFLEHGYAQVSIPAIAGEAGVSPELVYKAFGAKTQLLKALFDRSVVGDDEPVAVQDRPAIQRMAAMTDAAAVLDAYAGFAGSVQQRVAPVYLMARDAAAADSAAAPIVEQMDAERLSGMSALAAQLVRLGSLRDGLTHEKIRDTLWALNASALYELLVLKRQWTQKEYVEFVRHSLKAMLLP
jgi:AcrR family transcriptional regulator